MNTEKNSEILPRVPPMTFEEVATLHRTLGKCEWANPIGQKMNRLTTDERHELALRISGMDERAGQYLLNVLYAFTEGGLDDDWYKFERKRFFPTAGGETTPPIDEIISSSCSSEQQYVKVHDDPDVEYKIVDFAHEEVCDRVEALEKRIEALERNSHPPMPADTPERLEALEQQMERLASLMPTRQGGKTLWPAFPPSGRTLGHAK